MCAKRRKNFDQSSATVCDVFSERLKTLRSELNLTQDEFAKVLNITRATLSHYECATRAPDIVFLYTLFKKTHCSIHYLLGLTDAMCVSNTDVDQTLGLCDTAIANIRFGDREVINYVLGHPAFANTIDLIEKYQPIKILNASEEDYATIRDFTRYQIDKVFGSIVDSYYQTLNKYNGRELEFPQADIVSAYLVRGYKEDYKKEIEDAKLTKLHQEDPTLDPIEEKLNKFRKKMDSQTGKKGDH